MTMHHSLLLTVPLCFAGGVILGLIYFSALKLSARLLVEGGNALAVTALTLGRLALMVAGFALAVLPGAVGMLAMLAGVLMGRAVILRRAERAGDGATERPAP